jgi:hypothetical protein
MRFTKEEKIINSKLNNMLIELLDNNNNIYKRIIQNSFGIALFLIRSINKKICQKKDTIKIESSENYDTINWSDTIIYTALIGDYDDFIYPSKAILDHIKQLVIFTDQDMQIQKNKKIKIIKIDTSISNPQNINRCIKMNPHIFLDKHSFSLYFDSNIWIYRSIHRLIKTINSKVSIMLFLHPDRSNVMDEINYCVRIMRIPLYSYFSLKNYISKFNLACHTLFEANIILRRGGGFSKDINKRWWNLYQRYPYRDQFLLYESIKSADQKYEVFNKNIGNSRLNSFSIKTRHK